MSKIIPLLVALALGFTGCQEHIRREKGSYIAEVRFVENASSESSRVISDMLDKFCICENGEWSDQVCGDADEVRAIMAQRMPYHTGMMLFLSEIKETQPQEVENLTLKCGSR